MLYFAYTYNNKCGLLYIFYHRMDSVCIFQGGRNMANSINGNINGNITIPLRDNIHDCFYLDVVNMNPVILMFSYSSCLMNTLLVVSGIMKTKGKITSLQFRPELSLNTFTSPQH